MLAKYGVCGVGGIVRKLMHHLMVWAFGKISGGVGAHSFFTRYEVGDDQG